MSTPTARRAIGIVRVSQVNGRDDGREWSPDQQLERIRVECDREGLRLVGVHDERDVSGGKPLEHREGLRLAVEAIENGQADVIAAAYFDRLFRSLTVQAEVVERVERAGGEVLAVDVGQVTNGSAGQWLSGTMLGAVSEYQRRTTAERTREAQARAIARGIVPWPNIPPGFETRLKDKPLIPNADAGVVVEAFRMRANPATIADVRAFLAAHGIDLSYHGVQSMLRDRLYLGEIHFGSYEPNLSAHPAIVDRELWNRVQRVKISRGRRAKSDRLLARLGVLRCATCGGRMVVGTQTQHGRSYPFYRCGHVREDCPRRVTISAEIVEEIVIGEVRRALADAEGRASVENNAREAERDLERARANLDAALRTFAGFADEQGARDRLAELGAERDRAQERVDHLGGHRAVVVVNADRDWDRLSLDARRALIRATVDEVRVAPGRGADRVTVKLVGE
jgi:site-specific DNA recombinase